MVQHPFQDLPEATLYAAPISLYSGKARAYLRYKRLPFEEVLPSQRLLNEVIEPRTGVKMIPVLITHDDQAVQDTSLIIDHVEAMAPSWRPVVPEGALQRVAAHLLELYADEWLLMPAMHYRWGYWKTHLGMILREFGELSQPGWPSALYPVAGVPLALYFGLGHGRVLGINAATRPEIERTYEAFLARFETHLERSPYLLGERPTLADFGFMAPLYAHLYRDPVPGQLMRRVAPKVADWVERMNHPEAQTFGALLKEDALLPTLSPILRQAVLEQMPVVRDTWRELERWRRDHEGETSVPRFVSRHRFKLGEAESERAAQSYTAWLSQRTFDAVQDLNAEQRARLEASIGAQAFELLDFKPPMRLERARGRVRLAN